MADASTLLTFKDFGLDDFAVVSDHSEQGRNVVGFISSFLQQISAIERTYAKSLFALTTSAAANFESSFLKIFAGQSAHEQIPDLAEAWETFKVSLQKVAEQHSIASASLLSHVCAPLDAYVEANEVKDVLGRGTALMAELASHEAALRKSEAAYQKSVRDKEKAEVNYRRATAPEKRGKLQDAFYAAERFETSCRMRMQEDGEQLRRYTATFEAADMPSVYEDLGALEAQRIRLIRDGFETYVGVQNSIIPAIKDACYHIQAAADAIDAAAAISDYVGANRTAVDRVADGSGDEGSGGSPENVTAVDGGGDDGSGGGGGDDDESGGGGDDGSGGGGGDDDESGGAGESATVGDGDNTGSRDGDGNGNGDNAQDDGEASTVSLREPEGVPVSVGTDVAANDTTATAAESGGTKADSDIAPVAPDATAKAPKAKSGGKSTPRVRKGPRGHSGGGARRGINDDVGSGSSILSAATFMEGIDVGGDGEDPSPDVGADDGGSEVETVEADLGSGGGDASDGSGGDDDRAGANSGSSDDNGSNNDGDGSDDGSSESSAEAPEVSSPASDETTETAEGGNTTEAAGGAAAATTAPKRPRVHVEDPILDMFSPPPASRSSPRSASHAGTASPSTPTIGGPGADESASTPTLAGPSAVPPQGDEGAGADGGTSATTTAPTASATATNGDGAEADEGGSQRKQRGRRRRQRPTNAQTSDFLTDLAGTDDPFAAVSGGNSGGRRGRGRGRRGAGTDNDGGSEEGGDDDEAADDSDVMAIFAGGAGGGGGAGSGASGDGRPGTSRARNKRRGRRTAPDDNASAPPESDIDILTKLLTGEGDGGGGSAGASSTLRATEEERTVRELLVQAQYNDYYSLLEVSSDATLEEITRKRRELTQRNHPDRFVKDRMAQRNATAFLGTLNEVYTTVMKDDTTRALYDRVVSYRRAYAGIFDPTHSPEKLSFAGRNLAILAKKAKKANMPSELIAELNMAMEAIEHALSLLAAAAADAGGGN